MTRERGKRVGSRFKVLAYSMMAFGIVIILATTILYLTKTTELNFDASIDPSIFSSYGAFVGGLLGSLVALTSVFLFYGSLQEQKQAFQRQQIDNNIIQLVNIVRENSENMWIHRRSGKRVFVTLVRELYESYSVVMRLSHELAVNESELPNIAYLAFYYGAVGKVSEEILRARLSGKLSRRSLDMLFEAYKRRRAEIEKEGGFPHIVFDGHQSRLGHFYRHLFQAISYINEQPNDLLDYKEKYRFAKMIRAQLTTQEQLLLFWNSISVLGENWERAKKLTDPNRKLLTKYNFFKNIPAGFSRHLSVRAYYPIIWYEDLAEPPPGRAELEEQYR